MLATADADDNIRLWSESDGSLIATLSGTTNAVVSLVFSPDRTMLASTGLDYATRLWDVVPDQVIHRLRGMLGTILPNRWAQLVPDLRYQPACP